jgi:lysozyme family protein
MASNPGSPPAGGAMKGGIAAAALATILAGIYAIEGGYVNDPADHGGPTNMGVTEQVARADGYLGDMRDFPKHCAGQVITCADRIYVDHYIEGPGFTPKLGIEPAVAQELVDSAVNMGPRNPSLWFQASLNVLCGAGLKVDGRVGPRTIAAYQACQQQRGKVQACVLVLDALDGAQEARYRKIVAHDSSQAKYLKGWLRLRINNVDRKTCGRGTP